jgi:hypothetical protein
LFGPNSAPHDFGAVSVFSNIILLDEPGQIGSLEAETLGGFGLIPAVEAQGVQQQGS